MPRMIVKHRSLRHYNHRALSVGDSIEVRDRDAAVFRKAGWAEDAPLVRRGRPPKLVEKQEPDPEPRVTDAAPEAPVPEPMPEPASDTPAEDDTLPDAPEELQRYMRRDLRATED